MLAKGGFGSVYYVQFTELCNRIYNCLRRNVDIFINKKYLILKKNNTIKYKRYFYIFIISINNLNLMIEIFIIIIN